jgi:hypothetical protein
MQKPVNSEIDLIRAIYTRSNDLLLEAKAKKLTPKEPDLYSGVAAPVAPVVAAPAPAVASKTTKSKSKSTAKAKPAVSEPMTDTTTERVNIDPMTKKQGNAVFAKPKASVSPAISSIPMSSTISTTSTKYGDSNVATPGSSNPKDLNKDGSVTPTEMKVVPSQAYMIGQGLGLLGRTVKNAVNSPKVISGVLGAGILAAGILGRNIGMNQQMPANKSVTPITAQSDTPPTSSSFEAPPDPGQRKWTPYNYFTDPKRVAPINEQQEITEYYRQVLAQKLMEQEHWGMDKVNRAIQAGEIDPTSYASGRKGMEHMYSALEGGTISAPEGKEKGGGQRKDVTLDTTAKINVPAGQKIFPNSRSAQASLHMIMRSMGNIHSSQPSVGGEKFHPALAGTVPHDPNTHGALNQLDPSTIAHTQNLKKTWKEQ